MKNIFNRWFRIFERSCFKKHKFRFSRQLETLDCAPACLRMVAMYHGKDISLEYLRKVCKTNKLGTSIYTLTYGAEKIGLDSVSANLNLKQLSDELPFPSIILWNKLHFVALVKILPPFKNRFFRIINGNRRYVIADPGFGVLKLTEEEFAKKWLGDNENGVIIFMEPNDQFIKEQQPHEYQSKGSKKYLFQIFSLIKNNKTGLFLILAGMLLTSLMSIAIPILTQRIVDIGIHFKSFTLLQLILVFQVGLYLSMILIDMVKSTLLLHIGAKIELGLTHDFLTKLMKLPLYYFDRKLAGDLMQRISDNGRIQNFVKNQLIDFVIAVVNLLTLSILIFSYNTKIFTFYLLASLFGVLWAFYFIRKREILDYRRFDASTENADNLIETIVAMPEIKLNNAEEIKKSKWQRIQLKLFDVNTRLTLLQQYQNAGANTINQLKNITVTFFAAQQVILGNMTLGEMIAISAIVGQLNVPLYQIVGFIQNLQDARISFQRLAEIQFKEEEDAFISDENALQSLSVDFDAIRLHNIDFSYSEDENDLLFKGLSLTIPNGKITAIVGASGSGKTTLMKLLLKFYHPLRGSIYVGNRDLKEIASVDWRKHCGVVMQEGHIFGDTVEKNIAMSSDETDVARLRRSAKMSCIDSFIETLPMAYSTKIGSSGIGISTGQKQRVLIARAIYKDPEILFFDEATSSLDATTEKIIQENLEGYFKNRTVLLIAHRLSTVKNADNIIVLEQGKIIEEGTHDELIVKKGTYYQLIKNQLELGN